MIRWVALLMAIAAPASAQRAIMEGVAASRYTVKVDTVNARVLIDTTSYTGGISNVGLFVASNVVVGNLTNKNACVIYATGSVTCLGVNLSSGPATLGISTGAAVNASMTGAGTSSSPLGVNSSSGTLQGNTFNGASQLVQMTAATKLPAVDGSLLTNLPSSGHTITTGTLSGGSTGYSPAQPNLVFDGVFFTRADDATHAATFMSLNTSSNALAVTTQTFLSGSGTYVSSPGASRIIVRFIGGGGGGGGSDGTASNDGSAGGDTSFNSVVASGGGGGQDGTTKTAGLAAASGSGTASFRHIGNAGGIGTTGSTNIGGFGADGPFGGGAPALSGGVAGVDGKANTGAGGSGASSGVGTQAGGGGASGEYVEWIGPAGSYSYSVGAGGAGGSGAGNSGGAGGSGSIYVYEYYPSIGPTGATGATGAAGADGANGVSFNGGWTAPTPSGSIYLTTATNSVVIQSSLTVSGAGGLGVTYGITAGSVTAPTITVSSLTVGGYNVLGAWYTYTPSLSCGSGALTSASAVGSYIKIGKTFTFEARATITDNGTCASVLIVGMPFTAAGRCTTFGNYGNAKMVMGTVSGATQYVRDYIGNYPAGNSFLDISGTCEAQ